METEKRLIDANALMDDVEMDGALYACLGAVDDVRFLVESQPTVDAVEVVRCKNCVKAVRHEIFPWSRRCKVEDCRFSHKETHFCSYGERKDNERKAD